MSEGFSNEALGGALGTLIRSQIQSANFNLAAGTGWAILKNGNAYFFNITATGTITGSTLIVSGSTGGIFIYSGPPALGNLIGSWAGTAGTDAQGNHYPQGLNISVGTISGSTISGSVFNGTDFVLNTNGAFFYSGTPALGNLIGSITSAPGSDTFGNVYSEGLTSYASGSQANLLGQNLQLGPTGGTFSLTQIGGGSGVLQLYPGQQSLSDSNIVSVQVESQLGSGLNNPTLDLDGVLSITPFTSNIPPAAAVSGAVVYGSNTGNNFGQLKYEDSQGAFWQLGANAFFTTGTQQFTTTGQVTVVGLSAPNIQPGQYLVRLKLWYAPSGVIGSTHNTFLNFSGAATANLNAVNWQAQAASAVQQAANTGIGIGTNIPSPTHVAFAGWLEVDGIMTVSIVGTLSVAIALTTAGDDITTKPGSYLIVRPLP